MAVHGLSQSLQVSNAPLVAGTSTRHHDPATRPTLGDRTTQVQVSRAGELLEKLGQVQNERPGDFKGIMLELAKETQSAIASSDDATSIRTLRQLMDRITKAMDEGSLRALTPELGRSVGARNAYDQREDALLSPSEQLQGLLGRFLDKVSAVLPRSDLSSTRSPAE